MPDGLQLAENVRHRFCAPVQVQWTDGGGRWIQASGTSLDVSVYGLGLLLPCPIPVNTEVAVVLDGVAVCGTASIRHSETRGTDFHVGMQFNQALFMQKVPGLDEILVNSFYANSKLKQLSGRSTMQQLKVLLARALFRKN